MEEAATTSLMGLRHPRTPGELRSILGMCNVYRRFIRGYTEIAAPLYTLLKGDVPKELPELDAVQDAAYRTLTEAVNFPPVLALPRSGLTYSLDTDAGDHQVGCALFQTYLDGTRRPLGFLSRTLAPAERNYSVSERECLAVVYGITTCRPYLFGEHFVVNAYRAALRWLMEISDPSGRLMRWRLRLAE